MSAANEYDSPYLSSEERASAYEAARVLHGAAEAAEPDISATVQHVASTCGAEIRRFETRIKSLDSIYRKIQKLMVDFDEDAADAAAQMSDVVRFTLVVDESGYWTRGTTIGEIFALNGMTPAKQSPGWKRAGYRGRNESFISKHGYEFEVQIHTRASFEVAEQTHHLYEKARDPRTSDDERQAANQSLREAFASVPTPDDVPWVD